MIKSFGNRLCHIIAFIFLFLLLTSCQEEGTIKVDFDSAHDTISLRDIIESITPIILDSPIEESLMPKGRYSLTCGEQGYFVLDLFSDYAIHVFDSTGKFIQKLAYRGKDTGQYKMAYDMLLDEESGLLVVLDPTGKIIRYTLSDGFSFYDEMSFSEVMPAAHSIGLLSKGVYGLYSLSAKKPIYVCSFVNKTIMPVHNCQIPAWLRMSPFMFSSSSPFYLYGKQAFYFDRMSGSVYTVGQKGLRPYVRWDFGDYQIKEKDITPDQSLTYYVNLLQKSSYRHIGPFGAIAETDRYILANCLFRNQESTIMYDKKEKRVRTFQRTTDGKRLKLGQIYNGSMYILVPWDQASLYVDSFLLPKSRTNNYLILKYDFR